MVSSEGRNLGNRRRGTLFCSGGPTGPGMHDSERRCSAGRGQGYFFIRTVPGSYELSENTKPPRPTIVEGARRAHWSIGTVSTVLNGVVPVSGTRHPLVVR